MILSKGHNSLYIGDASAVNSMAISINKYIFPIALTFALSGLIISTQIKLIDGTSPTTLVFILIVLLAFVFGSLTSLATVLREVTGNADVRLVVIDADEQCLNVYRPQGIGLGVKQIEFSEVVEIRSTRGDWNGASVASNTAIGTAANGSIIMPEMLDDFEVLMIAYYLGLRESTMLLTRNQEA